MKELVLAICFIVVMEVLVLDEKPQARKQHAPVNECHGIEYMSINDVRIPTCEGHP